MHYYFAAGFVVLLCFFMNLFLVLRYRKRKREKMHSDTELSPNDVEKGITKCQCGNEQMAMMQCTDCEQAAWGCPDCNMLLSQCGCGTHSAAHSVRKSPEIDTERGSEAVQHSTEQSEHQDPSMIAKESTRSRPSSERMHEKKSKTAGHSAKSVKSAIMKCDVLAGTREKEISSLQRTLEKSIVDVRELYDKLNEVVCSRDLCKQEFADCKVKKAWKEVAEQKPSDTTTYSEDNHKIIYPKEKEMNIQRCLRDMERAVRCVGINRSQPMKIYRAEDLLEHNIDLVDTLNKFSKSHELAISELNEMNHKVNEVKGLGTGPESAKSLELNRDRKTQELTQKLQMTLKRLQAREMEIDRYRSTAKHVDTEKCDAMRGGWICDTKCLESIRALPGEMTQICDEDGREIKAARKHSKRGNLYLEQDHQTESFQRGDSSKGDKCELWADQEMQAEINAAVEKHRRRVAQFKTGEKYEFPRQQSIRKRHRNTIETNEAPELGNLTKSQIAYELDQMEERMKMRKTQQVEEQMRMLRKLVV